MESSEEGWRAVTGASWLCKDLASSPSDTGLGGRLRARTEAFLGSLCLLCWEEQAGEGEASVLSGAPFLEFHRERVDGGSDQGDRARVQGIGSWVGLDTGDGT